MVRQAMGGHGTWLRRRPWVWISIVALGVSAEGCSSGGRGYPDVQTTSLLGKPGNCHQCCAELPEVAEEHVLDMPSARFIVCCPECRERMQSWYHEQNGGLSTTR